MIVCTRTVRIPMKERKRFIDWIEENKDLREHHGILFELVLWRSTRQGAAKTMRSEEHPLAGDDEALVLTAWASHKAFDAWIETPDRDRLTDSPVHRTVAYGPITRHDVVGGYLDVEAIEALIDITKEEP